jgi:hypothetical protein
MGRYYWSRKRTVEECKSISVFTFRQQKAFCGITSGTIEWKNASGEITGSIDIQVCVNRESIGDNYVRFTYTSTNRTTNEKKNLDYNVQLVRTPCYFGGFRYWFICGLEVNGRYCGRRVAKLYLPPGGIYFGCRHCYNLTYRSCQEHDKRMDWARRLPPEILKRMMESGDPRTSLLGIRATFKNLGLFKDFS